jgi:hypothetical protein
MDRFEILIDRLLVYVPADLPFVAVLMQRSEGRYIIFAIAIVLAMMLLWIVLAVLQMMFDGKKGAVVQGKTPPIELSDTLEPAPDTPTDQPANTPQNRPVDNEAGFSFFKKTADAADTNDDEAALMAIEQEMLAVRRLYTEGHLIKDVYVSETRRLYSKAVAVTAR